ncbi:MAG: PAS domain S-box protein, partial [Anaerolineae bacterium]
ERAERFDFTAETLLVNWGQIYVPPNSTIQSVLDLQGKRIAVLSGDIYYPGLQDLLAAFNVTVQFVEVDSYPRVLELVSQRDVAAGLTNRIFGAQFEADYRVDRSPIILTPIELRFAAPKGKNPQLLSALDRRLAGLKKDPRSVYHQSLAQWLGGESGRWLPPPWLAWALPAGIGVLALAVGLNLLLSTLVQRRTAQLTAKNQALQQEIAHRQQAEEKTKLSDLIMSSIKSMVLVADRQGEITYANPSVYRTLGYAPQDVLGRGWLNLTRKTEADRLNEQRYLAEAAAGSARVNPQPYERKVYDRQGNPHWILWQDAKGPGDILISIGADITEHKLAEEALKESEQRYRTFFENTPEAVVVFDAEQRKFIDANDNAARLFGLSRDDLLQTGLVELSPPVQPDGRSSPDVVGQMIERTLAGETPAFEWVHRNAQGRDIECEVRLVRLPFARRKLVRGSITDISFRKRVTDELTVRARQQAAVAVLGQRALSGIDLLTLMDEAASLVTQTLNVPYAKILERLPDGSGLLLRAGIGWQGDYVGRAVVDAGANSQAGYTLAVGKPVVVKNLRTDPRFSGPPLLRDHNVASGVSVIIVGRDEPFGILGAHTTQRRDFSQDDVHFMQAVANVLAGAIVRKRAEETLRQNLTQIEQAKLEWEATVDSLSQLVCLLDSEGRVIRANRATETWNLRPVTNAHHRGLHNLLHPNCAGHSCRLKTLWLQAWDELTGGRSPIYEFEDEVLNRHLRLQLQPISRQTFETRDKEAPLSFAVAVVDDITERKQLEEQFRQSQKMEAVGKLAGGVAHDFNNILTVISGYSDLLLHRAGGNSPHRSYIEEISKATERAASLTRQLLAFSRKQVLKPEVVDLNVIVADMDKMLRRLIGENIKLITVPNPDPAHVKVDPGQMQQVILNLAVNARDAMPRGGSLTVKIAEVTFSPEYVRQHIGLAPGRHIALTITDTGHGMDPETVEHIFEPFFTTKERGKGTGLGLSTVYGIVQQSGGHITVNSRPNRGTEITIYLPPFTAAPTPASEKPLPAPLLGGTETILLAEDEIGVRKLMCSLLSGQGYTVLEAANGEEALRLSEQFNGPIHLLLADVI